MREIAVISGKGGTGKTSLVGAFAAMAKNALVVDCDVDAADLHLLLAPEIIESGEFIGGCKARIDEDLCSSCSTCYSLCRYGAIIHQVDPASYMPRYRIDELTCEGCKVCVTFCPDRAIEFEPKVSGHWYISKTRHDMFLVHAKLGIAEENSGKLVSLLREKARELAKLNSLDTIIIDGSPGTACPVIAALTGANLVLIVTEPTLSGLHDLNRVLELADHFNIPSLVCINKYDINLEITGKIEKMLNEKGMQAAAKLPYDDVFTRAQVAGTTVIEYAQSECSEMIKALGKEILTYKPRPISKPSR